MAMCEGKSESNFMRSSEKSEDRDDIELQRLRLEQKRADIELQRLRLERRDLEFRRSEAVARLAIELGRKRSGRGGRFTPDPSSAAKLLADAGKAWFHECGRDDRELKRYEENLLTEYFERTDPPLRWHPAKRGVEQGSGGPVSCAILCQPRSQPDVRIHIGRLFPEGWEKLGTWEVMRDKKRFFEIVKNAVGAERIRLKPEGEIRPVTESDVRKVLQLPAIPPEFFHALAKIRKGSGSRTVRSSAGIEPKPPRGKRKGVA
jgi:hypothetical protein